jgi:hypothetical protein
MKYFIKSYDSSEDKSKKIYKKTLQLVNNKNFFISNRNKLTAYALNRNNNVIGVLFISDKIKDFSWDILTEGFLENEIYLKLTILAISEFRKLKAIYGKDYHINLNVSDLQKKKVLEKNFYLKVKKTLKDESSWVMTKNIEDELIEKYLKKLTNLSHKQVILID